LTKPDEERRPQPASAMSAAFLVALLVVGSASDTAQAWGPQGHRLVALLAANRLMPAARQSVAWLLNDLGLADVAVWADQYVEVNHQTAPWHYVNVPLDASSYDRDRDCPRQPGVSRGSRSDRWRDCVVDRIASNEERLADASLDRDDRAIALKFLVHLVGDAHQPFHALGVARGGNDIPVAVFGSATCGHDGGTPRPCNLHGAWDSALTAHRRASDRRYLDELERRIKDRRLDAIAPGSPAEWAMESHALAKSALVTPGGAVDEAYYRAQVSVADDRLALAGLRLAAVLNRSLGAASAGR
jgi:nuclease S1